MCIDKELALEVQAYLRLEVNRELQKALVSNQPLLFQRVVTYESSFS